MSTKVKSFYTLEDAHRYLNFIGFEQTNTYLDLQISKWKSKAGTTAVVKKNHWAKKRKITIEFTLIETEDKPKLDRKQQLNNLTKNIQSYYKNRMALIDNIKY